MSVQALNRKEAIASGEDIAPVTREEYYLKGLAEGQGGGGLDYVIPEQTLNIEAGDEYCTVSNVSTTGLTNEDVVVFKGDSERSITYKSGMYVNAGGYEGFTVTELFENMNIDIWIESDEWRASITNNEGSVITRSPIEISVIKAY